MEEIFNRQCSECCHEVPVDYNSNVCPNCGAESIPTVDCPVIKMWPDNSSVELFWDGRKCMAIRTSAHASYPSFEKLEFPENGK